MPPPLPACPTETISLPARTSVLEESRVYHLDAEALVVVRQAKTNDAAATPPVPEAISFRTITQIRLRYFPTRVQTNRYECIVSTRGHGELKITNEIFKGIYQFEDQSAEYRAFVIKLCQRVADANPQAIFVRGRNMLPYVLEHGFLIAMIAFLGWILWLVGGVVRGLVFVKLGILAFYIPRVFKYARTNRPAPFDPRAVPAEIFPK